MEVQKEAQRIMTMSVWKMYHSRMQRGGLRLHRSLQLSLVMRNARDLYLSAKLEDDDEMGAGPDLAGPQPQPQPDFAAPSPPPPPPEGPPSPASPAPLERLPRPPAEASVPGPQRLEAAPLPPRPASPEPEPMETQQAAPAPSRTSWSRGAAKPSRKRRSSSLGKMGAAEAGLAPSKKAKLAEEEEGERQPQRQEGPFPSLARVLQGRFAGLVLPPQAPKGGDEHKASCRQGDGVLSILVRAVVAF